MDVRVHGLHDMIALVATRSYLVWSRTRPGMPSKAIYPAYVSGKHAAID